MQEFLKKTFITKFFKDADNIMSLICNKLTIRSSFYVQLNEKADIDESCMYSDIYFLKLWRHEKNYEKFDIIKKKT